MAAAVNAPALGWAPFRGSLAVAAGLLTARQLDRPAWRRLFRDVYIRADAPVDHLILCQAAACCPAGAALSHGSAALIHGADLLPLGPSPVHLTVPLPSRMTALAGLSVHHARLDPDEVVRRRKLLTTSPRRTAFDLGRGESLVDRVIALDALLLRRVLRSHDLGDIARERMGWPGVSRFRDAVALSRGGAGRSRRWRPGSG